MAGTVQPIGAENGARRYQLFIDGKFRDSRSGKTFESVSPHDRSVVAVVAEGDKPDIDAAVTAARAAYEGAWSAMPSGERAKLLLKIADLLEANGADLGRLETLDMGMPAIMSSSMGAISADVFRYWPAWRRRSTGSPGSRCDPATISATRCASRSAWSAGSPPGTGPS